MASTSCVGKSSLPMKEATSGYCAYPPPLAKYEEVADNPKLFMFTLEKLHASMGTKFMIPIVGGRELDLHRLFVEVTSRGGIAKIIRERKWKDVTSVFNFPSTATNASFVLRKYYASLLYHYEQIYYFKAREWNPNTSDILQNQSTMPVPPPKMQFMQSSSEIQPPVFQQSNVNAAKLPEAMVASSAGSPVIGVIDGKFESGYLVTVTIGSEKLKGVLYQAPQNPLLPASLQSASAFNSNASAPLGVHRRRRRKKSEIKRRDPAHPKPNRSGYNFFFAEQHARLKPLHHGKDREISRMIGEHWNKLKESEKAVYQEKAVKDKERYRAEMEDYREKLKMGQIISDAVPLQQRLPEPETDMMDADMKLDEAEAGSPQTPEESSSGGSDFEDDKATEKDFDMDALPATIGMGAESSCLGSEDKSSKGEEIRGRIELQCLPACSQSQCLTVGFVILIFKISGFLVGFILLYIWHADDIVPIVLFGHRFSDGKPFIKISMQRRKFATAIRDWEREYVEGIVTYPFDSLYSIVHSTRYMCPALTLFLYTSH
ncbi:hypothetical protein VNO77_11850 [Canavalia gladiata]|uniref:High mobility group B protein 15 n=1 Tax=Canavalia gladiata TaxID=3824 RepID=A0AAN9QPE8_CANGL